MQEFYDILQKDKLSESRSYIMDNIKTVMSCSSGSAFPTVGLELGMLCYRTDQMKLYQLRSTTPVWVVIADVANTLITAEDAQRTYSALGHVHVKSDITDWEHQHEGADIANATTTTTGVIKIGTGLTIAEDGTMDVAFKANAVYVNPTTAKDGDIKVVGSIAYMFIGGAYRQIYPAVYSS